MKINLKSSLSVFVALILGCGSLSAKAKEEVVVHTHKSTELTDEQMKQQAEEAKKKAKELAAAVKEESQEATALVSPIQEAAVTENIITEEAQLESVETTR